MKVNKYHRDFYNKTHRPSLLHVVHILIVYLQKGVGLGHVVALRVIIIPHLQVLLSSPKHSTVSTTFTKNAVSHVFLDCKVT